jgi:hypothetical protein
MILYYFCLFFNLNYNSNIIIFNKIYIYIYIYIYVIYLENKLQDSKNLLYVFLITSGNLFGKFSSLGDKTFSKSFGNF